MHNELATSDWALFEIAKNESHDYCSGYNTKRLIAS